MLRFLRAQSSLFSRFSHQLSRSWTITKIAANDVILKNEIFHQKQQKSHFSTFVSTDLSNLQSLNEIPNSINSTSSPSTTQNERFDVLQDIQKGNLEEAWNRLHEKVRGRKKGVSCIFAIYDVVFSFYFLI
jgi:hypothetical protein